MQSVWNKLIMIRYDETSVKVKRYRKHNQCKSETSAKVKQMCNFKTGLAPPIMLKMDCHLETK